MRRSAFITIFLLFSSLLSEVAYSNNTGTFSIDSVQVECGSLEICQTYRDIFSKLIGRYSSYSKLKESIKIHLLKGDISELEFKIRKHKGKSTLYISFEIVPIIKEIIVWGHEKLDASSLKNVFGLKEGEYYKKNKALSSSFVLERHLKDLGYLGAKVQMFDSIRNGLATISLSIELGRPTIVKDIDVIVEDQNLKARIRNKFWSYVGESWNEVDMKLTMSEVSEDLYRNGHVLSRVRLLQPEFSPNSYEVAVKIEIELGDKFSFSFHGNNVFTPQELAKELRSVVTKSTRQIDKFALEQTITRLYKSIGFYNVDVKTVIREVPIDKKIKHRSFFFNITEGNKMPVREVLFQGNLKYSDEELTKFMKANATELASREYFDEKFYQDFVNILKKYYWQRGHVFINILGPTFRFGEKRNSVSVEYIINEGQQTNVTSIAFTGLTPELESAARSSIQNKENHPLNVEAIPSDIEIVLNQLRDQGYYYANLVNQSESQILKYNDDFSQAKLYFEIETNNKIYLDKVIIIGNNKTKPKVINREIHLVEGNVIKPADIQIIHSNLMSLGLFSTVNVSPLEDHDEDGKVNLLVSVKERNFGQIEVTPGFRTDIGLKFGVGTTYNNLGGANRSISLKGQVNQRLNYDTLDPSRREVKKRMIEYNTQINFGEPYLFGSPISFAASFSNSRKRFRPFDAKIIRANVTFGKELVKALTSSLRYQFENISQENATDPIKDNGSFTIGSITPALTLDLRDNKINPIKGSFFNLSCEFANPFLLSQKDSVIVIDFFKVISRNRFYIPTSFGTIAMSMSGGYQKNLATELRGPNYNEPVGRIPSIKAFRLSGQDIVRGFADDEINILGKGRYEGRDIGDVPIYDSAYFVNFKLEPRIFLGDTMMMGVFLDAGRVFIDNLSPFSLRSSTGISFKYLTPVGTLDFEYGVKLHRKREQEPAAANERELESVGRFHISIGFF